MKVYEIIADKILEALEEGVVPWQKPWTDDSWPKNLVSGKKYSGVNVLLLGIASWDYASPYWLTFKQATQLGGHVKKGEKSTQIVFVKRYVKKYEDENGDEDTRTINMLRYYKVFNAEQCEGIKHKRLEKVETEPWTMDNDKVEKCEKIWNEWDEKPGLTFNSGKAYYNPSKDKIGMPKKETFVAGEEYFSTLYHEMIHSTGHKKRLDRKSISDLCVFGSTNYSEEELIAEIGAAFLCGRVGIENKTIDNSAAYIGQWLKKLQDDKRMVISAASKAQKAVDLIMEE